VQSKRAREPSEARLGAQDIEYAGATENRRVGLGERRAAPKAVTSPCPCGQISHPVDMPLPLSPLECAGKTATLGLGRAESGFGGHFRGLRRWTAPSSKRRTWAEIRT
jgi:hypothetical protein